MNITEALDTPNPENIILYLPEIMKNIFITWEESINLENQKIIEIQNAKNWNGIIKCTE